MCICHVLFAKCFVGDVLMLWTSSHVCRMMGVEEFIHAVDLCACGPVC